MGRGRAKAKQQKVARKLKYSTGGTDLDRLRSELGVAEGEGSTSGPSGPEDPYADAHDDLVDRYADLADKYSDSDK
ncbi:MULTISPECIES: DUF3073 domain-containing protein [Nocardiopsis]|jgi:hypothetical protein|uniref:DUF3073 domain-containing protein n=2 Tax=Nocardiopsis alba TaxID=53437 RepID=A0A7K2IRU3_9ACTN|nr:MULTISPECIES: DUF3073 domain-containing protein [Nocardiopsis]AFR10723.1 hypothetical protein B005_1574 [Nocardiopsis alba ATCC BAA-2165]MEC3892514.1 DUF3073 domain-containing protein [Nocardiopsis sp. LDBS1602]MYR32557.1 DUF3073 family protein [Nocardiopsis alba]